MKKFISLSTLLVSLFITSSALAQVVFVPLPNPYPVNQGGTGQITYTNGQLLIGNTATGGLTKATLTAGNNVSITNTNGAISIAATAGAGCSVGGTVGQLVYNSGSGGCLDNPATVTAGGTLTIPAANWINITDFGQAYRFAGIAWTGTTPNNLDTYLGWNSGRTGYTSNTGGENVAIGYTTACSLGAGNVSNVFIGGGSGCDMAGTGSHNIGIGRHTFRFDTAASGSSDNVAVGEYAMDGGSDRDEGSNNVAVGSNSLSSQNTASRNTAVGYKSLQNNSSGADNTGVGANSIGVNTVTGSFLVAVGSSALGQETSGSSDVAVGYTADALNTTGSKNTGVGHQACYANVSSDNNSCFGYEAGFNSTGAGNTFIGNVGGLTNVAGANNTTLGFQADVSSSALTGATAIGYNAKVAVSNTTVIGGSANTLVTLAGHVTATGSAPALSTCGTSSSILGNDEAGTITEGSIAVGCIATFATAYGSAPHCSISSEAGLVFTYVLSTTAITVTNVGALSSTKIDYICQGA